MKCTEIIMDNREQEKNQDMGQATDRVKDQAYLSGSGVIELILIMVVLIAVVILFKGQITALAELIFGDIFSKAGTVF